MSERVPIEHESRSEPLDQEWFHAFQEAGGAMEAYDYLDGDKEKRAGERALFEAGSIENPALDYPKLDPELLQKRDDALSSLKQTIIGKEFPEGDNKERMETVRQVYRWKINEKLASVRMLKAAALGDMRKFKKYAEFVYGKPSSEIFSYSVNVLRNNLQEYKQSDNEELRNAATALDNVLPNNLADPKMVGLPDKDTFEFTKDWTMDELGHLIDLPEGQEEFNAVDIDAAFQKAITRARIEGWKTVVDTKSSRVGISTSQETKTVTIPGTRNVTRDRIEELIFHEIGTHAVRRDRGERSKLMLLGLGLDRYRDDEGVTGLREQVLRPDIQDFTGLDKHFAISLAIGVDGEGRNFREVYEIMKKYFLVEALVDGKEKEAALKSAMNQSWNTSVRTFRGTDCKTPGVAFPKDIMYREANMDAWEVVRSNPDEMMRFNIGKYDPANPRHIAILDQLGITDADLAALEA